jgi:SNF2 family DNA or RNA helicase
MPLEFVMILSSHRKLGNLLYPYLIERKNSQSFFQLVEILTVDNYTEYPFPFTANQVELIKLSSEYSERKVHKIFCKGKNLKEFFDSVDEHTVEEHIRPYCEKRIFKCLQILKDDESIKIYRKEKNYQVVHNEEEIKISKELLRPVFNFYYSNEELKYSLSLESNNSKISLFNTSYTILSNQPLGVLLDKTIFLIDSIDSKKIIPFFNKDFIIVPPKNIKKYLSTFVKSTIAKYPVKAHGFDIEEISVQGKAILYFEPDLSNLPAFRLVFKYQDSIFEYAINVEPSNVILTEQNNTFSFKKISRNPLWETEIIEFLKSKGLINHMGSFFKLSRLDGDVTSQIYETVSWLNFNSKFFKEKEIEIISGKAYENYYTSTLSLETTIEDKIDWFDIKATVEIEGFSFPFIRFRKNIINNIREFELPNNKIIILPCEWYIRYRDLFIFASNDKESLKIRKFHSPVIKACYPENTDSSIDQLEQQLCNYTPEEDVEPKGLSAQLRSYQKRGLYWMYQLYKNHLGGCLADDMGLGKTIQTIALLLKIKEEHIANVYEQNTNIETSGNSESIKKSPFTSIIVMPVSLLHNWENEISKFAPSLRIINYFGNQRTKDLNDFLEADIVLTSYGIIRNEIEQLKQFPFKYAILDESQLIKNPNSKIYKAVLQLEAEYKLVLTGTPIENSLIDLWSQLNFVNRNMLLNLSTFKEEFVTPIERHNDKEKEEKLKQIIHPFILRRRKEDVLQDLPLLSEQIVYCDMTDEQKEIYEQEKSAVRNEILRSIDEKGYQKSSIIILKALNHLRLISNHPILVNPDYKGESGKYEEITRNIDNIISEKHKVLIFSSYVKHLHLIEKYLQINNYQYVMLTGSTINRKEIIDKFQNDEKVRVFLISLKAGGTGLNLTAADYVFLIDPWWNPAAENQAISRAHRIGQDKKVFVYRYITAQSLEQKIISLQQKKLSLLSTFIHTNNPFKMYDEEDIVEIFS